VIFVSNSDIQGEGWELSYSALTTGLDEINTSIAGLKLRCYPNPAKDYLRVELTSLEPTLVSLSLVSADGRQVTSQESKIVSGSSIILLNTGIIRPGIYFLKYSSADGGGMRKVIVNR
jgi:hypothetical protein